MSWLTLPSSIVKLCFEGPEFVTVIRTDPAETSSVVGVNAKSFADRVASPEPAEDEPAVEPPLLLHAAPSIATASTAPITAARRPTPRIRASLREAERRPRSTVVRTVANVGFRPPRPQGDLYCRHPCPHQPTRRSGAIST